jgi:hypothetical protein
VRAQRSSVCALPMPRVQTTALRAAILTLPTALTAVRASGGQLGVYRCPQILAAPFTGLRLRRI